MNRQATIEAVTADQVEANGKHPEFSVGDTLDVHVRIIEGEKERVQVYQGVLIGMKGRRHPHHHRPTHRRQRRRGADLPAVLPRLAKIEVVRRGDARRAKLYYLRERVGKSRRLRDQRRGLKHLS